MASEAVEVIPVVDISDFVEGGPAADTVVEKISVAATESGFFW